MAAIDAALSGMARALDPVGYIDAPPDFVVTRAIRRGGLTIEAGKIGGWHVLRYARAGWTATAIVAHSDEWFFLKVWGNQPHLENGLSGIMRDVA